MTSSKNYSSIDNANVDHQDPIFESSQGSYMKKGKWVVGLLALASASAVSIQSSNYSSSPSNFATTEPTLKVSAEFERRTGRTFNDGILHNLVRVYASTTLELDSGEMAFYYVEHAPHSKEMFQLNHEPAASVDHTFTEIGKHNVRIDVVSKEDPTVITATLHETVSAKIIRAEIRDLTTEDREIYFDALRAFQFTSQGEGVSKYGKTYKSLEYLLREHLYGAADRSCDHWHDDAGMVNHHVGITWQFEQSIRMVDSRTAAHYWDYTREAGRGIEWYASNIFDDEWFGSNSPNNADHIVDKGRFAYSPISKGLGFSDIVNPYGFLRSPWNTNNVAYLSRSNYTFFDWGDAIGEITTAFPECSDFADYVESSLAEVIFSLNGLLHGPVHIMIGGHWDASSSKWKDAIKDGLSTYSGNADMFLLLSKFLWRQGFVHTPESCSSDTAHSDCMASCPETIVGSYETMTNEDAKAIMSNSGALDLASISDWDAFLATYDLSFKDMLKELCHVGTPGEMYSSSAPQDPTFWPLHGNAERFITFLRVSKAKGLIEFDETWGYEHISELASDNGIVCDWSEVEAGSLEMPTCSKGTCSGHKEDDLLPFTDLYHEQGSTLLTNSEFYQVIHPYSDKLPYAFDTFSYWEACDKHNLFDQYASSSKVKAVSKNTEGLGGM